MPEELGPSAWKQTSLDGLAEYINGFAFTDSYWSNEGLPIVRIAQITGSQGIVDRYQGLLSDTFRLTDGDLIFSWSGTLAVVRWNGGPAWLNQHLFKVIPRKGVDRDLLFHLLQASVAEMDKRTHGSTMKHIKRGELRDFIVSVPVEADEQRALARVLDALDGKIRQTEAIIKKLKQVKQGLLHDLLTRGIDANGELRPPQSEAPHLYKESPLGWIPREWEAGMLADWLEGRPKNGYSPQPAGRWTGIQMLGLGCLTATGFQPRQLKDAPAGDPLVKPAFLAPGDLLMSRANTRELVGMVGTYRDIGTPCCYPDLMMKLTPNSRTSAMFLELVLGAPAARRQIQASASGTSGSMVKISSDIVMSLSIAAPCLDEQHCMLNFVSAYDERIRLELESCKQLSAVKSGLMDDLLTGRVRVTSLIDTAP
ncbi:restriction endonuclease subunit S [Acidovorax sp.]|uniref:restriction endonuclease subunit S n=1 Tax=Acidovorax sp. TaxID=1872122 RepID=UPI002ACDE8E5|nr:restriction endonuclease subunit S [Acidovorax sp.]MDZ7865535.1 restriction endonuclease subunit S [Acidovorax sp.]